MRLIRNVIPTGLDWDSISFAVVYVMDKNQNKNQNKTCTGLSVGNNREEMALEQQVAQPARSNTLSQNQPTQQHGVLSDD